MGAYQTYRGNPEQKLLYTIDQLIGGVNTDFSDDTSPDNEFQAIVNFTMDKRGSLYKRKGFGKQDAISQIMNMFKELPEVKTKSRDLPDPEKTNDNIVYAKLLRDDNGVFRELAKYEGVNRPYRAYQQTHGKELNKFTLLFITTNYVTQNSKSWLYSCTFPDLIYDDAGLPLPNETIVLEEKVVDLPVHFDWNENLKSIDTIDFFNDIYFTNNSYGVVKFNLTTEDYEYYGPGKDGISNMAYKPNPMEIRKLGFNVLGDDPLRWVDYQGLLTDSIQGIYLTTNIKGKDTPTLTIPSGGVFKINVLYTGSNTDFTISFKEGDTDISSYVSEVSQESKAGLKVYDVVLKNVPTNEVEIKVVKNGASVNPYYDYYSVGKIDVDAKPLEPLNLGSYGICEMYNRAVYYKGDTIWFSAINNFSYVPNYNYVILPIDKTDEITKIIYFRNVYIVFTKFRIYKMIGAFGTSEFSIMPVNLAIGCHAPNTIVPIENELYFASTRGLYSLRSSEFRDGIENLKELDTKVKRLTSEVTNDTGDIDFKSYNFNGIEENAYALRYKDQYMLLYNNYSYKEDYYDITKIDALVYNYSLKAFTEIKFPIKPTFIFMVDNRITTYCKYPVKEEYTKEDVLIDYDFDALDPAVRVVPDKSGNGYDAKLVGETYGSKGLGVRFNDDYSAITNDGVSNSFGIDQDMSIQLRASISPGEHGNFINLRQNYSTGVNPSPQTFTLKTGYNNGYSGGIYLRTEPNIDTKQTKVYWTFTYYRSSTSVYGTNNGTFSLINTDTSEYLVSPKSFSFNMGSGLSQDVASGSFVVSHDSEGNYRGNWKLYVESSFRKETTYWENGSPITFNTKQTASWAHGLYGIRLKGKASVKNGVGTVTLTPYVTLGNTASLYVGERTMTVWVDGTSRLFGIPSISSPNGNAEIPGKTKDFTVRYTGAKRIFLDASYNIRAEIAGVYRENLDIDGFYITMPRTEQKTDVEYVPISMQSAGQITLNKLENKSYRPIVIAIKDNTTVNITLEDERKSVNFDMYLPIDYLTQDNLVEFDFRNNGSGTTVTISVNDSIKSRTDVNFTITNSNRGNCRLFDGIIGVLEYYCLRDNNYNPVFEYTFFEGAGEYTENKANGNTNFGWLTGDYTWITSTGLSFAGGYLLLPELPAEIRFTNGFSIEFDAELTDDNEVGSIISLTTMRNAKDRCFIQVYYDKTRDIIGFRTSTLRASGYRTEIDYADLSYRHKWKMELKDEGSGYVFTAYCDGEPRIIEPINYGNVEDILRTFNTIGYDNSFDSVFKGIMHSLKITVFASENPIPVYDGAIFEYDTSYRDFGWYMDVLLETKGINMRYPLHIKKLKNVFIKGLGGFDYNKFFFELYVDGHLVNDPRKYECYIDEISRTVVYDYTEERNLEFNERSSMLDYMRLDKTRLGDDTYETKKMVVPAKGKNFAVKIYGKSADYLKFESFGFVCKLGKVRED